MLHAVLTLLLKEPELVPLDEAVKVEVIKYILGLDAAAGITFIRRDATPEFKAFTIEGSWEDLDEITTLVRMLRENPYLQAIGSLKIYEPSDDERLLVENPELGERVMGSDEKNELGFLGI